MEETLSRASLVLIAGVNAASLGVLFFLFQRHIGGTPLVHYEPRRRVPWGPVVALAAMIFPFTGIAFTLIGADPKPDEEIIIEEQTLEILEEETAPQLSKATKFVVNGLSTSALMIAFVTVVALFLHASTRADPHDLGLPASGRQLLSDIGLGTLACVVSIFPTFAIQYILTLLLQPEAVHPMIEEFQDRHTPGMLLVGLFMVVVAAPLFEEFSFRLLLQGWLEKWEDESIGYSATMRPYHRSAVETDLEDVAGEVEPDFEVADGIVESPLTHIESVPRPVFGVLPDLPHGWLPILVSSTLFGLAHFGHGVSPIPLVLFGMVLGYLYQRTHRLVPSMTAHALFNGYSMTLLWLNL